MISFLTLASHYMGMINVKSKLKNQVYTVMAFIGNWYLLYIGIRFLQNGHLLRGFLLLAIFLIFLYFSVMNIFYFFTTKPAPFDISPTLEKYIGGTPEEVREREEFRQRLSKIERQSRQTAGRAGVFDQQMLLPAELISNEEQQKNIEHIVIQMKKVGTLVEDYGGLSDAELKAQLTPQQTETYAIGDQGVQLPYADIKMIDNQPVIFAGVNQFEALPIGTINKVGLSSFEDAKNENHLYLADALLNGGEKKTLGRSGMITENENYSVKINIAYKRRNTSL